MDYIDKFLLIIEKLKISGLKFFNSKSESITSEELDYFLWIFFPLLILVGVIGNYIISKFEKGIKENKKIREEKKKLVLKEDIVFESDFNNNKMTIKFSYNELGDFYINFNMSGSEVEQTLGTYEWTKILYTKTEKKNLELYKDCYEILERQFDNKNFEDLIQRLKSFIESKGYDVYSR